MKAKGSIIDDVTICTGTSERIVKILDTYRARIAALDFVRLSGEESERARLIHADAVASARIEGAEMTPQDAALCELLLEMRVPYDVAMLMVADYSRDVLAALDKA